LGGAKDRPFDAFFGRNVFGDAFTSSGVVAVDFVGVDSVSILDGERVVFRFVVVVDGDVVVVVKYVALVVVELVLAVGIISWSLEVLLCRCRRTTVVDSGVMGTPTILLVSSSSFVVISVESFLRFFALLVLLVGVVVLVLLLETGEGEIMVPGVVSVGSVVMVVSQFFREVDDLVRFGVTGVVDNNGLSSS